MAFLDPVSFQEGSEASALAMVAKYASPPANAAMIVLFMVIVGDGAARAGKRAQPVF